MKATWEARAPRDRYQAAIQSEVEWVVLRELMALCADNLASETAREIGTAALIHLARVVESQSRKGDAHSMVAEQEIRKFFERQLMEQPPAPDLAPPGSPIG